MSFCTRSGRITNAIHSEGEPDATEAARSTRRKTPAKIRWAIVKAESLQVDQIIERAVRDNLIKPAEATDLRMSLTACHLNGCPLRLVDLLKADAFNFAHDVYGIHRNVSRDNGKLLNFFRPRFAVRKAEAA